MQTHHLRIQRSARYHTLGELDSEWNELWYVLHGYGQLAERFLAELEPVARPGRVLVAPEGLSRFYLRGSSGPVGASWMTREDREREIDDSVAWLEALHVHLLERRDSGQVRIGVLGFSQGTATAARWVVLGGVQPSRLVLWAGGLPPDLEPDATRPALARVAVDLVVGSQDQYVTDEQVAGDEQRLRELDVTTACHRFQGGHRIDTTLLAKMLDRA